MRFFTAAVAVAAIGLTTAAASAQVQPGEVVNGNLTTQLDSKSTQEGQPFTLSNVTAADGSGNVVGGTIYGHVTQVITAGQGRKAQINLGFDRFVDQNGNSYRIDGRVQNVNVQTKSNAGKEVVGAVVGDLLGNYLGKHIGTNLGGAFGAAGGFLYAKNSNQNITVPQNSVVSVQILNERRQPNQ